ncbi:MAG: hypothetical protein ABSG53_26745 [Thermoguttaceae bacterium]|jgi:hypothetical protein
MPSTVRFGDLPRDMQQLVADITDRYDLDDKLLTIVAVAVSRFPYLPWTDERSDFADSEIQSYFAGVRDGTMPPLVVCGCLFLDGCHRLTAARRLGANYLPVIDLAEIGIAEASIDWRDIVGPMVD